MEIEIAGKKVQALVPQHFPENFKSLLNEYEPFENYIHTFSKEVLVEKLEFESFDLFGPRIGFLKFKLTAFCGSKELPGIVFMRGGSVAILVIVNEEFVLLTNQYRLPIGRYFEEVPAGMIDSNEHFSGAAARELEEECGIKLSVDELCDLGEMVPSAGGCDEVIHLYSTKITLSENIIRKICSTTFGEGEHESIRCSLVPIEQAYELSDAKLLCCLARFDRLQK